MLLDQIPGLQRAVRKAVALEESVRRQAFLPCVHRICGVDVRPFTPRHFMILDEAVSPFLGHPGSISAEHVAQLLWVVSPQFLTPTLPVTLREVRAARLAFAARIRKVRYEAARRQLRDYLDHAFLDAPRGGGDDERPLASTPAFLVDRFASAYHWPVEQLDARGQPIPGAGILDKPFAQLFQLSRLISLRTDPHFVAVNPLSDRVERECVRRHERRRRAKRKGAK